MIETIQRIRQSTKNLLDYAETHPGPGIVAILAGIPDSAWRFMLASLRHPTDDAKALEEGLDPYA